VFVVGISVPGISTVTGVVGVTAGRSEAVGVAAGWQLESINMIEAIK
jgi:hypothetical protein